MDQLSSGGESLDPSEPIEIFKHSIWLDELRVLCRYYDQLPRKYHKLKSVEMRLKKLDRLFAKLEPEIMPYPLPFFPRSGNLKSTQQVI